MSPFDSALRHHFFLLRLQGSFILGAWLPIGRRHHESRDCVPGILSSNLPPIPRDSVAAAGFLMLAPYLAHLALSDWTTAHPWRSPHQFSLMTILLTWIQLSTALSLYMNPIPRIWMLRDPALGLRSFCIRGGLIASGDDDQALTRM